MIHHHLQGGLNGRAQNSEYKEAHHCSYQYLDDEQPSRRSASPKS
jgi:hypothetical protein